MNRLQFLKTIGTGVAAAVIAPNIVIKGIAREEPVVKCLVLLNRHAFTEYGHYEEDIHWVNTKVCYWDLCIDKNQASYVVTHMDDNKIGLTAVLAETEPNTLTIDKDHFGEYFVIIGQAFHEGTGGPK